MADALRWTLAVEYDDLDTQARRDPQSAFPDDDASRLIRFLIDEWGLFPEDLDELVTWSSTRVTSQAEVLDYLIRAVAWIPLHTTPKTLTLTRNDD